MGLGTGKQAEGPDGRLGLGILPVHDFTLVQLGVTRLEGCGGTGS